IQEVEEALTATRPLAHPERQEARLQRVRLLARTGDPERAVEEMVANWDALVDDVGPDARITREVAVVVLDVALEAGLEPAARGFALEHVPGRIGATAPEAIAARRVLGQMLVERGRIEEGRALVEAVLAAAIEA